MNIQQKKLPLRTFASFASFEANDAALAVHKITDGKLVYERKEGKAFGNHIEMAGFYCAGIISYGHNKDGKMKLLRHIIFPMLRKYPNDTHSSLDWNFKGISFKIDGSISPETLDKTEFDGCLHLYGKCAELIMKVTLLPARNSQCFIEKIEFENKSGKEKKVEVVNNDPEKAFPRRFSHERKEIVYGCAVENPAFTLESGEKATCYAKYYACLKGEEVYCDFESEINARYDFISSLDSHLEIKTPDETINSMLRFAKIRASESIFKTKNGLMHSPGGGGYYAALWTNDQCEYVNPLFGYLGFEIGAEEAINCYNLYRKYISSETALVTSIIAEGDGVWHGAKDRGDSAMYAYGLSRFLLSYGDKSLAETFLEPLRQTLEYTLSQKNESGVIMSDSDELENRFESGNANLSTSCLTYDALLSCAALEAELGNNDYAEKYIKEAALLCTAVDKYFARNVEGFESYRYCAEETNLRSWICLPLCVGIFTRREGTAAALLSDRLKMRDGLVTRSGEKTFWDRSTLYALRGLFYCGETEKAYELLQLYTNARHLGMHIPYAVEACPEGNQAQLSAESALYIRIFTEGILGYRPCGFKKFTLKPNLPQNWNYLYLRNIKAHGACFDIEINRSDMNYIIKLPNCSEKIIAEGETIEISLPAI